ncbi:MAG: flagellar biosynthesis protein FlhB [Candidatus Zixiibacteriota bacterium]|nr:MAG: flagellar biosynthesis protein FlhB [candidate division Zixibacteria bacterium]
MPESSNQERTEQPTEKRRRDARKRGQVAKSMELNSVAVLSFGLFSLFMFSSWMLQHIVGGFTSNYELIPSVNITLSSAQDIFIRNGLRVVWTVLPLMAVIAFAGIAVNFIQVGANISVEPITPKAEKLDFVKGFKRIFSQKTAVELAKNILKLIIVGIIAFLTIKAELSTIFTLPDLSVGMIIKFAAGVAFKLGLRIALALLFLSVLDFAFQKYDHIKNLRMTRQEVKEEFKEHEGDPQIKSRVKRIQREMAQKRMLKEVEKADVVLTNPTHVAVALQYDMENDLAPRVVAKGERLIAEKIKEIAEKFGVPVIENKPLARALFEIADIGMMIPEKLYRAVAEVLAHAYKLKGKI